MINLQTRGIIVTHGGLNSWWLLESIWNEHRPARVEPVLVAIHPICCRHYHIDIVYMGFIQEQKGRKWFGFYLFWLLAKTTIFELTP
jgi:hypothetical protein